MNALTSAIPLFPQLGPGDLHEKRYDGYRRSTTLYIHDTSRADFAETRGHYIYSMVSRDSLVSRKGAVCSDSIRNVSFVICF